MYSLFPKGNISKDPELQQELERCLKLRDGASRILPLAQNRLQQLDAIKTLFVTNEQVLLCLQRVQREKMEDAMLSNNTSLSSYSDSSGASPGAVVLRKGSTVRVRRYAHPGLAKLCLSDIRIPLLWRDSPLGTNMQVLMNRLFPQTNSILTTASLLTGAGDGADKSDSGEQCDGYAVFCLARLGPSIRETRLIFDIRPGTSDVEFDDKLIFDNVTDDFHLVLEVYAYPPSSCSRSASVFSRRRTLLMDLARRTMDQPDASQFGGKGIHSFSSYFELVGRCVARLPDVQNRIRAHALITGQQQQLLIGPTLGSPTTTNPDNHADDSAGSSLATSPIEYDGGALHQAGTTNGGAGYYSSPMYTGADPFLGGDSSSEHGLPLFGSLCYRLVAQPHSVQKSLRSGWLWIRKLTASPAQSPARLYWCELCDRHLWAYSVVDPETDSHQDDNGLPGQDVNDIPRTELTDFSKVSSPKQSSDHSIHPVPEEDCGEDANGYGKNDTADDDSVESSDSVAVDDGTGVSVKLESQPLSSTPRTNQQSTEPMPHIQLTIGPAPPSQPTPAIITPDTTTSRVPRLVLDVTPKTLFLDANPTLRSISVCDVQEHHTNTEPNFTKPPTVRLRPTNTHDQTEAQRLPILDEPINMTTSPTGRMFRSPKPPRKLREIKAAAKSSSLSNMKQLRSLNDSAEQLTSHTRFHSDRTVRDDLLGLVSHHRRSRPSMEDNLPWFSTMSPPRRCGGSLDHKRPLSTLDVSTPMHDLSTSFNVLYSTDWTPPKPKNAFWTKVAVSQTLPRLRHGKQRATQLYTLSRSMETLPIRPTNPLSQIGIPPGDSTTDQSSVASEPIYCNPCSDSIELKTNTDPQVEQNGDGYSASEVTLFTFRIATATRVLDSSSGKSLEDVLASPVSSLAPEVFEMAVSKPGLQSWIRSLRTDAAQVGTSTNSTEAPFADEDSTGRWLTMFQSHVTEQKTWGPEAFSKTIHIPEVASSARDAGTRRSLAFF